MSDHRRLVRAALLRAQNAVLARLWLRGVALGRRTVLTGRPWLRGAGAVEFGDDVAIVSRPVPVQLIAEAGATLRVGSGSFLNYGVEIHAYASVVIGARALLGHYVHVMDSNGHGLVYRDAVLARPVVIEDDVWLGQRVTVLPGACVGRGSVVSVGSVVRGTIPPDVLACGDPAVPVRDLRELDAERVALERAASLRRRAVVPFAG